MQKTPANLVKDFNNKYNIKHVRGKYNLQISKGTIQRVLKAKDRIFESIAGVGKV